MIRAIQKAPDFTANFENVFGWLICSYREGHHEEIMKADWALLVPYGAVGHDGVVEGGIDE
jgi:hypothetical protein